MEITFLFGNGLDMQCKLDTSYYSFFEYILKKKYDYILDIENKSKEGRDEIEKNNKTSFDRIDNIIYKYIIELKVNKEKNWVDLETNLGKLTEDLNERDEKNEDISSDFFDSLEELREDLEDFLKKQQVCIDQKIDEGFTEVLNNTLINFYSQLKPKKYQEINSFISSFTLEHIYYNFISLNYTNTLEFILKNSSEEPVKNTLTSSTNYSIYPPKKVIHAHGVIGDALTLGVNDELQMACDLFENGEHMYLIKPQLIEEDGQLMKVDAEEIIKKSDLIVLFGVSLGKTDKDWWDFIGNSMIKNVNQMLLIHDFILEKNIKLSSVKSVRRRKIIEDKFLGYLMEEDDIKSELKKRIFVLENSKDILNIDLSMYTEKEIEKKKDIS